VRMLPFWQKNSQNNLPNLSETGRKLFSIDEDLFIAFSPPVISIIITVLPDRPRKHLSLYINEIQIIRSPLFTSASNPVVFVPGSGEIHAAPVP